MTEKRRARREDLISVAHKNAEVRERKLTVEDVKAVVNAMEDAILKNLEKYHELNFLNLFYIEVVRRKGWKAPNFENLEEKITIPDFNKINFKPSEKMKDEIKKIDLNK